jgi:hypothetical protein
MVLRLKRRVKGAPKTAERELEAGRGDRSIYRRIRGIGRDKIAGPTWLVIRRRGPAIGRKLREAEFRW